MAPSTIAAKNFDIYANDYSSSQSKVTLKTYNTSSSYELFLPSKNPKYLDGVSGDLQVASQVLTYDVLTQTYVWKQASSSSLFLQGQTTSIGGDENGNVMTILKEERVVAGDPLYDPSKGDDQQLFKATYQFTDEMYNMSKLVAGKNTLRLPTEHSVSGISFTGTLATATVPSAHGILLGDDVTISGVTGGDEALYNGTFTVTDVQATTISYNLTGTPSAIVDVSQTVLLQFMKKIGTDQEKTSGIYFSHYLDTPSGTTDEVKQLKDVVSIQTRKLQGGGLHSKMQIDPNEIKLETIDSADSHKSSYSLLPYKETLSFGNSGNFNIDNSIKSLQTNMQSIEFGQTYDAGGSVTESHRLCIKNSKLYIQRYNGSSWVGADIVVDSALSTTATISISCSNTVAGKIDVTATLGGTWDHWHVKLDDGSESMAMSGTTFQLDSTYIGKHQVVAYAADASHNKISEYSVFSINTTM